MTTPVDYDRQSAEHPPKRAKTEQEIQWERFNQQRHNPGGSGTSPRGDNGMEARRPMGRGAQRMCKYGMGCTRAECWFQHPDGWTAEKALASCVEDTLWLEPEDIPKLIGSGGSTIKNLCTQTGIKAHVNKTEDGRSQLTDGKASVTLNGHETGITRFKAMVNAKFAEIKLRHAGQWTEEMQRQQNDLMGTRDTVDGGNHQRRETRDQRPSYTAHNTAHNDTSRAGHYQQLFTHEGREYFCNTADRRTQWERPPPGSTIIPGRRPQPGQAMQAMPAQMPAGMAQAAATQVAAQQHQAQLVQAAAAGQQLALGTVLHAQNANVMPLHAALAATGQHLPTQVQNPVANNTYVQQMHHAAAHNAAMAAAAAGAGAQPASAASPTTASSPTAAAPTASAADPALYDKQLRNFQVYGGYYTADNQWVQGEPAKPAGAAAESSSTAPAAESAAAAAAPAAAAAAADSAAAAADAPAAAEEKGDGAASEAAGAAAAAPSSEDK